MNYEQVSVQLRVLSAGRERIKQDRNLSELGKERALKNLNAEIEQFHGQAHAALAQEWREVKARFFDIESEQARAELEESERWNYPKLAHERQALESKLKNVRDLPELEQLYSQVETSGVPERKRALFELTPEHALKFRSNSLAKKAELSLQALTLTPEMQKAQERGSALVVKAQELQKVTAQAREFYEADIFGKSEFNELMSGVSLATTWDNERLMYKTTLDIGKPEPGGVVWATNTQAVE